MTATCLNTNGIEAVLRICCRASGSIVFHGRKTTALSLTVSTTVKTIAVGKVGQGRHRLVLQGSPPSGKLSIPLARRALSEQTGQASRKGEMSEWLKEHAWKACVGE